MNKKDSVTGSPTLAEQADFYDEKWTIAPPELTSSEEKRVQFLKMRLENASLRLGRRLQILDFGCGRGLYSSVAAEFGDVVAIDLSPKAIELAKSRFPGPKYQAGSVYDFVSDTTFDVIMSLEVLEHLEEQKRYIEKCASLVGQDGELLLTMPNRRAWKQYWAVPGRMDTKQPIENWLTPKELKRLLLPWFDIVSISTHDARYGRHGLMRIANSTRLNRYFRYLGIENPIRRGYERIGLGVFQFVHARLRR